MTKLQRIKAGFNRLAPVYDLMAAALSFNYLHRSQTALLPLTGQYSKALIIGGGTGKFLLELIKNKTAASYCYVDISDKMVEATRKRLLKNKAPASVELICGSFTDVPVNEKFDLIVTNYFLDCFTTQELPVVMDSLHKRLNTSGAWLFVDFNIPRCKIYHLFASTVTRVLYLFFNVICSLGIGQLPRFSPEFARLGYIPVRKKYFLGGLLVARIYKRR